MGNLNTLWTGVKNVLSVAGAILRGFFVAIYDTGAFFIGVVWWIKLIMVAIPIGLFFLLLAQDIAISTSTQVINLGTTTSNLFWEGAHTSFRPLITYSIPYISESMEIIREFVRAVIYDELCPDGLGFECSTFRRVIGFFEVVRLINVGYTRVTIAFMEGVAEAAQHWMCNVEVLIDSANALQCAVLPENGAFYGLLDGLNDPTYFYLTDASALERVRMIAYFYGVAVEWYMTIAEDYLVPTALMVGALFICFVQASGVFLIALMGFFANIIFMVVRTIQVSHDPSIATGVWEDENSHITVADFRQSGVLSVITNYLDTYDPADLLRSDNETGYVPTGDPDYVEVMLEIVLTVGDLKDVAIDLFPTAAIVLDSTLCAILPPNTLDCAARFKVCEFLFAADPLTGGFNLGDPNTQPGVMSAALFELFTLLGQGVSATISGLGDVFDEVEHVVNNIRERALFLFCAVGQPLDILHDVAHSLPLFGGVWDNALGHGFDICGLIPMPTLDIESYITTFVNNGNSFMVSQLTILMDQLFPICDNLLSTFGAEEGGCICDACTYHTEQSVLFGEVAALLPLGLENGAPCIPWEQCCLEAGTTYYDRNCFPKIQNRYTSLWKVLLGSIGTLFGDTGAPDRCKELPAMLAPLDRWGEVEADQVYTALANSFTTTATELGNGQFGVYSPLQRDLILKKSIPFVLELVPISLTETAIGYPPLYSWLLPFGRRYDTWLVHMEWFRPTAFDGDGAVGTSVADVLAFSAGKVSPAPTTETIEGVLHGRCGAGAPIINPTEAFPVGTWIPAEKTCRYSPRGNAFCSGKVTTTDSKDPIMQLIDNPLDDDDQARWKAHVFPGMACTGFQWTTGKQCYSDAYARFVVPAEIEADFPEQKSDILNLNRLTATHAYCPIAYSMQDSVINGHSDDHAMCTMISSTMLEHWESGLRWMTYMGEDHMHTVANKSPEHFRQWERVPPWTLVDHVIQVSENLATAGEWCNQTLRLADLPLYNETYPDCVAAILALAAIYNATTTTVDVSNLFNDGPATPSFPGGQPWAYEPHTWPGSTANLLLGDVEVQTDHLIATPRVVGKMFHPHRHILWELESISSFWDYGPLYNAPQPFEDTPNASPFHKLYNPNRFVSMIKPSTVGVGIPLIHPYVTSPPFVPGPTQTEEDFRSLDSFVQRTNPAETAANVADIRTPMTNYPLTRNNISTAATSFLQHSEKGRWQNHQTVCANHSFVNELTQQMLGARNAGFGIAQATLLLLDWQQFFGVIHANGSDTLQHTCEVVNATLVCNATTDRCKQDDAYLLGITAANVPANYTRIGLDCETILTSGGPFTYNSTIMRSYFKQWTAPLGDIDSKNPYYLPELILDDFADEAITAGSGPGPDFHYYPARALLEGETRPGVNLPTYLSAFMSMLHTYSVVTRELDGGAARYGTDERLAIYDDYLIAQEADPGMKRFEEDAMEQCVEYHHIRPDICACHIEDPVVLRCNLDPYRDKRDCIKLCLDRHYTGPQGTVIREAVDDFQFIQTRERPAAHGY